MDSAPIKVAIIADFPPGASGGGAGFLQGLSRQFEATGNLASPGEADVLLFNSHHFLEKVGELRDLRPDALFLHRVDGPMSVYSAKDDSRDALVLRANQLAADGVVFQSDFSRQQNASHRRGLTETVDRTWQVLNAPDPDIFFPGDEREPDRKRARFIISSWSKAWNKGFKAYQWLDQNLDFERFEIIFIGNSPVEFQNIECRPPLDREELAAVHRGADAYLTASQRDPCSNSLIEAIHCGLPVLALADGGHVEIVGEQGHTFQQIEQVPDILNRLAESGFARQSCWLPTMGEVARRYLEVCAELHRLGPVTGRSSGNGRRLTRFVGNWRWKEKLRHRLQRLRKGFRKGG